MRVGDGVAREEGIDVIALGPLGLQKLAPRGYVVEEVFDQQLGSVWTAHRCTRNDFATLDPQARSGVLCGVACVARHATHRRDARQRLAAES